MTAKTPRPTPPRKKPPAAVTPDPASSSKKRHPTPTPTPPGAKPNGSAKPTRFDSSKMLDEILDLHPIDILDLMAKRIPRPPELVHGVLHQGSKMVIGGGSKSFKTWTLLDLALSVATGVPWWGFETTKGKVLYVNFEIQDAFFQERVESIVAAKDVQVERGQLLSSL